MIAEPGGFRTLSAFEAKACVVIGTRPSIVMMSSVIRELRRREVPHFILHSDQHYSHNMDGQFLEELQLPRPDHRLERVAGKMLHGAQTASMLTGCEEVFLEERPKVVLVGGDSNTNLAAALAARKLHIQVGHVEAGERSLDWRMPEEHNRVMIDHISEYLFATNAKAVANLHREGIRGEIVETGNPIVDAVRENLAMAAARQRPLEALGLEPGGYFLMTTHREENVDSAEALTAIFEGVRLLRDLFSQRVVFAVHPRTRQRIEQFGLGASIASIDGLTVVPALGYLSFLSLLAHAALVLTDSGGVQQEACLLQIPCLTLRNSTEWIETVSIGANVLVGTAPDAMLKGAQQMLAAPTKWDNPFGDRAAPRIVDTVAGVLGRITGNAPAGADAEAVGA